MDTDAIAVARASYEAYVRKDRKAMEALVAADFHFTSPVDNRLDRATYFERCWPNSDHIGDFQFVSLVPDKGRVFVTYVGRNLDGHRFQNTEIVTVRGSEIVDVEVYFGWSVPHEAAEGSFLDSPPS